jgi:hypothetical protein
VAQFTRVRARVAWPWLEQRRDDVARPGFGAIFLAGAGAAYLSGGFGVGEFGFCAVVPRLSRSSSFGSTQRHLGGTLPHKTANRQTANRRTGPNDPSATPAAPNGCAFRCRLCPVIMRVLLPRCGLRSQDEDSDLPCLLASRRRLRILCSLGGNDETAEKILCMGLC